MRVMLVVLVLLAGGWLRADDFQIVPTTTLAAETGNNTSAATSWTTSSNGNAGAANISKVDHRSLLYPGATTRILTNIMYWFGPSNHIQVGYVSNNFDQVKRQVDDHLSRGITGTIVDWYGSAHTGDNGATQYLKQYAESLPGYPFAFAIMEDKGALLSCSNTPGCDLNAHLVGDLNYIMQTYAGSPAYLSYNGRPAIFFFGLEAYTINWDWVASQVPGNPLFIFQNAGGYTHADTGGAFSWVMINTSNPFDWKSSYLDDFYAQSLRYPVMQTYGTTYKGFNDTAASWSLNRIMDQQCGQTWLDTWAEIGKYYNPANQLDSIQIATWNDYEEGTEIESGIDNCLTVTAGVSGTRLSWIIAGNEKTLDHYSVFVSADGQNLMRLGDVPSGTASFDLGQFLFAPGSYVLYVKAVGKPSIVNHMSPPVTYLVATQGTIRRVHVRPIRILPGALAITNPVTDSHTSAVRPPSAAGPRHNMSIQSAEPEPIPANYTVARAVTGPAPTSLRSAERSFGVGVPSDCSATSAPANAVVRAGETATFKVNFYEEIAAGTLSCSGLPENAACDFASATESGESELTISTAAATNPGTYVITVGADSQHSTTVTLTVQ